MLDIYALQCAAVTAMCWSASHSRLFTGSADGVLKAWDVPSGACLCSVVPSVGGLGAPIDALSAHAHPKEAGIVGVDVLWTESQGWCLVSGSVDGTLKVSVSLLVTLYELSF
jgi:WD40 repeat protein